MIKICGFCKNTFDVTNGRIFSNHVRWCDKNPEKQRIFLDFSKKVKQLSSGKRKDFQVSCKKCGKEFTVNEIISKHPQKQMYHCSRKCANSKKHSEETKRKQSDAAKKYAELHFPKYTYTCLFCGKINETKSINKSLKKHCNNECRINDRRKTIGPETLEEYRRKCKFKFGLSDYPEEFDFKLLEKYGFYKPSNKGNNINGVSRDHIISVRFGYDNGIDPGIISHPANCQLMVHSENISKLIKCDLTLEQLMHKIHQWDSKYKKTSPGYEIDHTYNINLNYDWGTRNRKTL